MNKHLILRSIAPNNTELEGFEKPWVVYAEQDDEVIWEQLPSSFKYAPITCTDICKINGVSIDLSEYEGEYELSTPLLSFSYLNCENITQLELSRLDTANVTSFESAFENCDKLLSLDLNNLDTSSVTSFESTFKDCSGIKSIYMSNINTSSVTSMESTFENCSSLSAINLNELDTHSVTSMKNMFKDCEDLTRAVVTNFNTTSLTNMEGMFSGCSSLEEVNISNFDLTNVNSLCDVFNGCSSLTSAGNISNLDVSNVVATINMFKDCTSLTELDLSGWDTDNIFNFTSMFENCTNLETLNLSGWKITDDDVYTDMFKNCVNLKNVVIAGCDEKTVEIIAGILPNGCSISSDINIVVTCPKLLNKTIGINYSNRFENVFTVKSGKTEETIDLAGYNITSTANMFNNQTNDNKFITIEFNNINLSNCTNFDRMFYNQTDLQSITFNGISASKIETLNDTFANCKKLESLDLSTWRTSNVSKLENTFRNCYNLQHLDLSGWDLSAVALEVSTPDPIQPLDYGDYDDYDTGGVNFLNIFSGCYNLREVKVEGCNSNTKELLLDSLNLIADYELSSDGKYILKRAVTPFILTNTSEEEIYVGFSSDCDFNVIIVSDYTKGSEYNFNDITYNIIPRGRNNFSLESGQSMFMVGPANFGNSLVYDIQQKGIEFSGDIMALLNKGQMCAYAFENLFSGFSYDGCDGIVTAPELPETELAEYCYEYMFNNCSSLINPPVLPATTLREGCYEGMFYGCSALITAPELPAMNLAEWCYEYMFEDCSELTNAPELPATQLAEGCYYAMFQNCYNLMEAPILPAETLVSSCYSYMFYNCSTLNTIIMLATDISAYDCLYYWTRYVFYTGTFVKHTDMEDLPTGSYNGIPAGWNVFDVSAIPTKEHKNVVIVKDYSDTDTVLYINGSEYTSNTYPFDYYSFNDDKTETIKYKVVRSDGYSFRGTATIGKDSTLNISGEFVQPGLNVEIEYSYNYPQTCYVGFNYYQSSYSSDFEYVFALPQGESSIEIAESFTVESLKNSFRLDYISVNNSSYLPCSITSIVFNNIDTSNVTSLNSAFENYRGTELDLSLFDVSNVTNLSYAFYDCHYLQTLNLSGWNLSQVTEAIDMFDGCRSLETVIVENCNEYTLEGLEYQLNHFSGLNYDSFVYDSTHSRFVRHAAYPE